MSGGNRAVGLREFGGADVLEVIERPRPVPAHGEALVKVRAATVNPTDTLFRRGDQAWRLTEREAPYTPGMELAGTIVSVEPEGAFKPGQDVIGVIPPWGPHGGSQAQFAVVDVRSLAPMPQGMDYAHAATLPMNGLTALVILELLDLNAGATIFVTGGAGALGSYVIAVAHERGLRVIADALDADHEFIRSLGADILVPRGAATLEAVRAAAPGGVDGVADCARRGDEVSPAIRDGGSLVQVRPNEDRLRDQRIQTKVVSVPSNIYDAERIREVSRLAEAGVLHTRIAEILPLEGAAEAHRRVERGGLRGRLVLDPTL